MNGALLLGREEVERLLTPDACIAAVEEAFRGHALGQVPSPGILGMHQGSGSFHVKAGFMAADRPYFAAKINANFPGNGARGLPTIQGAIVLFDAADGRPLALMDSISITALRTAAATAVAAKHLAKRRCRSMLLCGCGAQALEQLRAVLRVRQPDRVRVHDLDDGKAERFAAAARAELGIRVEIARVPASALPASVLVVTCTSARHYFVEAEMVRRGTFIAAAGADNEDKQEIDPRLLAQAKVVTDLTDQAARIGDLHHAIKAGVMTSAAVHAQLGEVVAGTKPGRENDDEIVVFDSTGTGLQDVAAAIAVYRNAVAEPGTRRFDFAA